MSDIKDSAKFKKSLLATSVAAGMLAAGSASAAAPDVTEVASDITAASVPIATVAGASLGVYVGLRVWKMVRRAI